ncbi:uroporphyrinogen-III synthase [Methanoculleus taiwanensis]|uniref:Uroporphyrinogen-III synthase n=1 Tax=Methanoculleus taiwanensis TaxID=1550565 RepID=A0A498GYV8_9EURY|nr:uroporphyrinogen-III synthase [Methanoculleus taiwanensis]RXE55732.1 uroporphyrinogen-III synthase [Methanoculleus taiwanensis]
MKIAITRLENKAADDQATCAHFGHECYTVSPLKAVILEDRIVEFADAVNREAFDCLFFTSALPAVLIAPKIERYPRVIAIGPKTAETLQDYGIDAETLPAYYSREFVPYLGEWLKGRSVGIPRADVPNPVLIEGIRAAGGDPEEVPIYGLEPTGREFALDGADALIFTSAMSFREARWRPHPGLLLVAIGDITADAMRDGGYPPDVTGNGTLAGTLEALNTHLSSIQA